MSKVREKYTQRAIYRSSRDGPHFTYNVYIVDNADSNGNSEARLSYLYSVPPAVQDRDTVLAGTKTFSPDEAEVFILTHPAKYKRTQTIIHVFITVKSESEAIESLI